MAMFITRTPWIDDDGSGTVGTVINNAEKTALYDQIDGTLPIWNPVPFNAGGFAALGGMTWTVGAAAVIQNAYAVSGKILYWQFYLSWFSGSNVLGGTPSDTIVMRLPGGHQARAADYLIVQYCAGVAGVPGVAGLKASSQGIDLHITKGAGGNFALSDMPGMITTLIMGIT